MDQPTRLSNAIASLSAQVVVGGLTAYALFDSGSNTDASTPEFTNAISGVQIQLAEPIKLQLGCKGSQSTINYGTRVELGFGGITGYHYFDQVNLDRYDIVIGTPFMNKHGLILDFAKREIRFPSGWTIQAMSSLEEACGFAEQRAKQSTRD
ncbi:hypothetical protein FB45DRAFT_732558 [Roridomyces roridus]|uniref:Uncharacterized protein n=1 Tax=Roridomyces roridus TaxID=1738132 RepID=A0AAD7CM28_9AGAR|nr:hypothetical protein FB45DRAFT_732558 [Roridomyces roridus]